ncbi:DUF2269 domain-containing protein [Streptomyces palmae]|uniref:DUF2269 domain-containing protein n=1 Tax=Streptomyces palmae TaxID=1701085 RepID=UPI001FD80326|nr:DUF2269 domain-containing protein [Streptomyces palmae]
MHPKRPHDPPHQTASAARAQTSCRGRRLSRPVRRALLVTHVVVSVAWLGITLCLLVLGITAVTTGSAATAAACYRAMRIFADWLLPAVSLGSLVTGLVLSLGTPWGLALHRWVYTKFWLTLAATGASLLALRPRIHDAAAEVDRLRAGEAVHVFPDLAAAPTVATSIYLFLTAISVLKPWGLTARGRRRRESTAGRTAPRVPAGALAARRLEACSLPDR